MRIAVCVLAASTLVFAGCGGGGDPAVLAETIANLGKIRSGNLSLSLRVGGLSLELHGPFSRSRPAPLPAANLEYTEVVSGDRVTGRLISTGRQVYLRTGDRPYAKKAVASLPQVHLADWFEDPELSGGGPKTDHVHAGLDTVAAAEDLIRLSRQTGISLPGLSEASPELLRAATRSTSVDLYTGRRDRLLRGLELRAELGFDVPIMGRMAETTVTLRLEIDDLNMPVRIAPPG